MIENYWPFWLGGVAISVVSLTLVLFSGKFISITRGYVSACSIITKQSYFHRAEMGGPFGYRTLFVLGVMLGGLLAALTGSGWNPVFSLGQFDSLWGDSIYIKATILICGGFLWGYGSRLARGCTSGNAIAGISRGSLASVVATICFLVGGTTLTFLINWYLGVL